MPAPRWPMNLSWQTTLGLPLTRRWGVRRLVVQWYGVTERALGPDGMTPVETSKDLRISWGPAIPRTPG